MACGTQDAHTRDVGVMGAGRPRGAKRPLVPRAKGVNTCANTLNALLPMGETARRALPLPGLWRHQPIRPTAILASTLTSSGQRFVQPRIVWRPRAPRILNTLDRPL